MDARNYVDAFAQDPAQRLKDFQTKVAHVRQALGELQQHAAVLSLAHNFAWITNGARSFINTATEGGVGSIYIDASRVIVVTNKIEGHRLLNEEMNGLQSEITVHEQDWFVPFNALTIAKELAKSDNVVEDKTNPALETKLLALRTVLTTYEQSLYRSLGADCGKIIGDVARGIRPSMTEWEIAAQLSDQCFKQGILPIVLLVAADERVDTIRHPLPTQKRVKNKAMLVLCGRRAGFVLSVTRLVYITTTPNATIPADLLKRHDAATYVDTVAIVRSTPGARACEVFKAIQDAYEAKGYPGEWKFHHQGGCAGYQSREWVANPTSDQIVAVNQAFAWNPSVAGTKSEDTVLVRPTADGVGLVREVLSTSPGWPEITQTVDGVTIARPAILHIAY